MNGKYSPLCGLILFAQLAQPSVAGDCDLARGERLFGKCAVCHSNNGSTGGVGPDLAGLIDRAVAAEPNYPYSQAMEDRGGTWTMETLDKFIASPMTDMPGTMMAFAGLKKAEDRRDLLCYLSGNH